MLGISGIGYTNSFALSPVTPAYTTPVPPVARINGMFGNNTTSSVDKSSKTECSTCANRKYVDGSNDPGVSFKTPGHISPEASASVVKSHEMEHVASAKAEDAKEGAELISTSVTLRTSICPECGKSYVSGGTTRTQMKYDTSTPYGKNQKSFEATLLRGMNFTASA